MLVSFHGSARVAQIASCTAPVVSKAATGSRRQTRDRTLRLVPDMTMTRSITTPWSNFLVDHAKKQELGDFARGRARFDKEG